MVVVLGAAEFNPQGTNGAQSPVNKLYLVAALLLASLTGSVVIGIGCL